MLSVATLYQIKYLNQFDMETLTILLATSTAMSQDKTPMEMNSTAWFVTGTVVALLLFAYLIYTLIKPEKF